MGATASTPANLVIGAGDVSVDAQDVGVTSGDNVFRINETIFEPELNGTPGMLVGTQYKVSGEGVLATTLPEVGATALALVWAGSRSVPTGDETVIDWDATRRIPSDAFHDYVLTVPGLDGKEFAFEVDNGLNQSTAEFSGQNAGMMAPAMEIHSKWDPAALTASPYRIRITVPAS